jgi:hypothetical protein
MEGTRRTEVEAGVEVDLPAGWETEADEEGGANLLAEEGVGLLHLVRFDQPPGEVADPAEELYAFLEDQGIELEEDDVEDVELPGEALLALCEYITEQEDASEAEDDEPATFWLVGVATAPGNLVFGSYSCPAGREGEEREVVRAILSSLRLQTQD